MAKSMVGKKIEVPYGNAYTPERQTQMTKDKIRDGIREVMGLVSDGAGACVDRGTVVEMATKLERQADKIYEAIEKDSVFVEEVRHHHNRLSDLCDNTRNYSQEQMVADLKRAAAIRVNVMTIVSGKPPEYEMEPEELDDLKSVRSMLRRKFGGAKAKKEGPSLQEQAQGEADQSSMMGNASAVKANTSVDVGFGAVQMGEEDLNQTIRGQPNMPKGGSNWAAALMGAE